MAKYTARSITRWTVGQETTDGKYYPARPLNHTVDGWRTRIALAWGVLTGRFDALDWEEERHE